MRLLRMFYLVLLITAVAIAQLPNQLRIQLDKKTITQVIERRLPPADLLEKVWPQIPAAEKPVSVALKTAWYTDIPGEFIIACIAVKKGDSDDLRTHTYYLTFQHRQGQFVRISVESSKSMDRIDDQATAVCNWKSAYIKPSDPFLTWELYQRLQLIYKQPEIVHLRPTINRLYDARTDKTIRSEYARTDERNIVSLRQLILSWQSMPPNYLGITSSAYDTMLWCDDGSSLWGFEWRKDANGWTLADWEQFDHHPDTPRARVRLCTIPVALLTAPSNQQQVGGADTKVSLTNLGQSAIAQLITRFLRLAALNNKNEVLGYFDQSIDQATRSSWWPGFQQSASQLRQLEDVSVTTLSNRQIIVSCPKVVGFGEIRCELSNANQLRVLSIFGNGKSVRDK